MLISQESAITHDQESALQQALKTLLVRFPKEVERRYQAHCHAQAHTLMYRSVYLLSGLYLLVVIPILLFVHTPDIQAWRAYGLYPIAAALLALWCGIRLPHLNPHLVDIIYLALATSLVGTLLGAMRFPNSFAGQISAFETIYLLIIGFSILRLPPPQTLATCLLSLLLALLISVLDKHPPALLPLLLYFAVPLIICTLNGYMLDVAERRNFANTLLRENESTQLERWRQQAEQDVLRQQQLNLFMERIAGNLTAAQLLQRVLEYLVDQLGVKVAAGYTVEGDVLVRQAGWGLNPAAAAREKMSHSEGLLGAALQQGQLVQHRQVPAEYLDMEVAQGRRQPATLVLWPIHLGKAALGIIEMGHTGAISDRDQALMQELHRPLAFALQSARNRQPQHSPSA